jgi:hypothetical protein
VIKTRNKRRAGHVARMKGMRNAYNISVGKPEEKRPFATLRHRRENNIKVNPK